MPFDLMIDLETLSTKPDCAILTLAAVKFDPNGPEDLSDIKEDDTFYVKIDMQDNDLLSRSIEDSCLAWWSEQNQEAIDEAFSNNNRRKYSKIIPEFNKLSKACKHIWSHGSIFDVVIIENLYSMLEEPVPWNFYQVRDTRTLYDMANVKLNSNKTSHHALEDCLSQIQTLRFAMSKLK